MGLTVEAALRETVPGSVLHVSSAAKLVDIAQSQNLAGAPHLAAEKLCRLALESRYGDVGPLFPKFVQAYLESDLVQW
jgi:hypothetical protein